MIEKLTPAQPAREATAEEIFDNFSRSMAGIITRREALKVAITGFAVMALSRLGISPAWAGTCLCNGVTPYDPGSQCCTPSGVVSKQPIADLNKCSNKVPNSAFICNPSGCGAMIGTPSISSIPGAFNFEPMCNNLYCCLAACNHDPLDCLEDFTFGMNRECSAHLWDLGTAGGRAKYAICSTTMILYRVLAGYFASNNYENLQKLGCDCCGSQTCTGCSYPDTLCVGSEDLYPSCCRTSERCTLNAKHAKCCPVGWFGYSDGRGAITCCPPGTGGSIDKFGNLSCKKI